VKTFKLGSRTSQAGWCLRGSVGWIWITGGMMIGPGILKYLEKILLLCPEGIPQGMPWDWSSAFAVRSRRLTAWSRQMCNIYRVWTVKCWGSYSVPVSASLELLDGTSSLICWWLIYGHSCQGCLMMTVVETV